MQAAAHDTTTSPPTALSVFREEHQRLDCLLTLFRQQSTSSIDKAAVERLIDRIDQAVRMLIELKEALFYGKLRGSAIAVLVARSKSKHQAILQQLNLIAGLEPDTGTMDMHMDELSLVLRQHMGCEERKLFPLAQAQDSLRLGSRINQRRAELREEAMAG
jgi:hemerythrin-like domain-containing protein